MRDQLPHHWNFALASAFKALRNLVHAFDFRSEVGRHAYVGVTPKFLVDVIDGFLGESAEVVLPGNRTELVQLRKILTEEIVPAFERGSASGRSYWLQSGQRYGESTVETLHESAQSAALSERFAQSWFVEGFCVAYSNAETESLRKSIS